MHTTTTATPALPPLNNDQLAPNVVREVVSLANDSKTTVARLSSVLMQDPILAKSVLKKANSPYYGFHQRIQSVDFAIVLLGFDVLKDTVAGLLVKSALRSMVNSLFHYEEFWNHSLSCGIVARYLAQETGQCAPDTAFIAGLLHDVGYLVIAQSLTDPSGRSATSVHECSTLEASVGVTHAQAGYWLAERWQLPTDIGDCIRWHHTPERAAIAPDLTRLVHEADVLCSTLDIARFSCDISSGIDREPVESTVKPADVVAHWSQVQRDLGEEYSFDVLVRTIRGRFIDAVGGLPEQEKVVMALFYYEGLSFQEIGQVLQMEAGAARVLQEQALQHLKQVVSHFNDRGAESV